MVGTGPGATALPRSTGMVAAMPKGAVPVVQQFRDDAACREELQSLGGQWALDKYDSFVKGSHRCDFWRYVQLHRSGGNYLDIKMALSQPWNQTLAAILEEAATDGAVQRWLERTSGRGQGLAQPTGDVGAQGSAQPADGVGSQSLAQAPPATVDQPLAVGAQGLAQPERQSAEQTLPHGSDGSQGLAQMEAGLGPAGRRPTAAGRPPGLGPGDRAGLGPASHHGGRPFFGHRPTAAGRPPGLGPGDRAGLGPASHHGGRTFFGDEHWSGEGPHLPGEHLERESFASAADACDPKSFGKLAAPAEETVFAFLQTAVGRPTRRHGARAFPWVEHLSDMGPHLFVPGDMDTRLRAQR